MATKFVRALNFTTGSSTARITYPLKLMYEFWGFCVNGGNSLVAPMGFAGNTTIAVGSNGATLPTGTINVVSTNAFTSSGTAWVQSTTGTHLISYTGKTATTLTGCTGGTGSLATGNVVVSTASFGGSLPISFNGNQTIIASGSNGVALPQSTINVVSTTGFPSTGTIFVFTSAGTQTVTYTGTTATTFTGCTGGTGTMSTGGFVLTSTLMAIGNDGYTNASVPPYKNDGYSDFFSASGTFTSNMVGKQLVVWKTNSGSSEDSIYNIIGYKSPTNIVVNVNNGGTPSNANDGYRPSFTARSGLNYRVINVGAAGAFPGIADGNFLTFQFDPTGINVGQVSPQLQLIVASNNKRMDYKMSPDGSWNGSAFGADASPTLIPNQGSSGYTDCLYNTSSNGNVTITLIGDKDYMIGYCKDSAHYSSGFHWHFEIPDRLYTQAQDPNPFAVQINGYNSHSYSPINAYPTSNNNHTYVGGFVMRCNDGVYRNWRTTVRALAGDGNADLSGYLQNIPGYYLNNILVGVNTELGTLMSSYAFLSSPRDSNGNVVTGQYSLARCRLRNVRFVNNFMANFTRFNSNGDYLLLTDGVAWPWDKTVIPFTLFPY